MRSVAVVVGAALAFGCVTSPVGPRGPLVGPSMRLGSSVAAVASYGKLGRGSSAVRGNSDSVWLPLTILPRHAELRAAPVSWADLGGSLGWLDANVDVRFGVPALPRRVWAGNVALGFRSGALAILDEARPTRSAWGRLELYPLLAERETFHGTRAHRGLLALGINAGRFFHQLQEPADYAYEGDAFSWNVVNLTRKELRIEGALGYVRHDRQSMLLLALEPYVAIDRGHLTCGYDCRFRQIWGVALVFDVNLFLGLQSQEPAH